MEQTDQVPAADDGQPQSERVNFMSIVESGMREASGESGSTCLGDEEFREIQRGNSDGQQLTVFDSLPFEVMSWILSKLSYEQLFQLKVVSRLFNDRMKSNEFHDHLGYWRSQEGLLTALHFVVGMNGVWQCMGYDLNSTLWKKLPPIQMLPPNPELFKEYRICRAAGLPPNPEMIKELLICGAGGMMCANVATLSSSREEIVVFNPFTGSCKKLPPRNHPRHPVLLHMVMDSTRASYRIIAAGSARGGHKEHLSKITEVYYSRTGTWTRSQDVPGPAFALNEYQSGVYHNGVLYCIAFLEEENSGKWILAFHVEQGTWLTHLSCPLPFSTTSNIAQLVECCGEIYLFSEIEHAGLAVEHRIDKFEGVTLHTDLRSSNLPLAIGEFTNVFWRSVIKSRTFGRGLLVYPEHSCVPFGEGKLCIFNTIEHTGIVCDLRSGKCIETLPSPSWGGIGKSHGFFTMTPLAFSFEPSFRANPF